MARCLILCLSVLWLSGCASYAGRVRAARAQFEIGNYDLAIEDLKKFAEKKDGDELLYLMDLGTVYHTAGRYEEATRAFLRAAEIAEIKDYTSLAEEAGSVILNDEVKPYKGEDFEKVLIHIYLAIDFTLWGKYDDALVECRKVNHILDKMIAEGKLPYHNNSFAKYLAATLFEARKEYNSAFVDYRTVLKWSPEFPYLPGPLMRVTDRLQASQELEQYRSKFPKVRDYRMKKSEGEVVVVVEAGKGPIKVESPSFRLVPIFQKRPTVSDYFVLRSGTENARTYSLYDIEGTAVKELDARLAAITAKKIAGVAAKQLIAAQVAKSSKSEGLGFLTAWLLHASDRADLRSWSTLPARLQLVRLVLPAGRHDLRLDMVTIHGSTSEVKSWSGLEVKPGQTVFLNYRSQD